jgi:hypothetical protein
MGDYSEKLAKHAAGVLQRDEHLLAGVRAMAKGHTKGAAAGGLGGAVGALAAGALQKRSARKQTEQTSGLAAMFPKDPMVAIGVTDQRLLVFQRSQMTGGSKDLQAEFPLARVASMTRTQSRVMLQKIPGVLVAFDDGSSIELEIAKLDKPDRLLEAFQRAKGAAT